MHQRDNYILITLKTADKDLRRLDFATFQKIDRAIMRLKQNPFDNNTKRLFNFSIAQYRHRVGDWRIFFNFEPPHCIILVRIKHRRDAYRI